MTMKKLIESMDKLSKAIPKKKLNEATEETKTGRIHKGSYGTSHEAGDDVKKEPTIRGRGRPKKDADETGEVKKYDFSAFTKPAKVGKHQGNVTKHSLKEWMQMVDEGEHVAEGEEIEEGFGDMARKAGGAVNKVVDRVTGKTARDAEAARIQKRLASREPPSLASQLSGFSRSNGDKTGLKNPLEYDRGQEYDRISSHKGRYGESVERGGEARYSAKDKKFAKLAPPKDKITYADKIAGAKKDKNDVSEATEETKTGRIHKGSYGTSHEAGDDVKKEPTVRGRGRPKKDADETGEVKKYDFSAFTKPAKVGKHQGNVTKHSLKEMDNVQVTPSKPQAGQMDITKNGKVVATADRTKATQMADAIKKGTVKINDPTKQAGTSLGGTVSESYNDTEYGGAGKGRSDDAKMTERLTRQAKAAAKKAGKTFGTSAEYRKWHAQQKEKQGVSESRRLKESVDALEHIMSKFKFETKQFIENDDLDHDLYEALFDFYQDAGDIPYGIAKGRTGDPFEWVSEKFREELTNRGLIEDMLEPALTPQMNNMSHKDNLAMMHQKDATRAIQFESWNKELNRLLKEGMTVSSSTGNDESPDTVSITATDADAEQLLSIVRNAGLGVFGGGDMEDEPASPAGGFSVDSLDSHDEISSDDYADEAGEETPDDITVVDDGDAMLELIKKIAGVSDAGPEMPEDNMDSDESSSDSVFTMDTDEDGTDDYADDTPAGEDDSEESDDEYSYDDSDSEEDAEEDSEDDSEDDAPADEDSEDDEEKVDESCANSADKTGDYDLQYIMRLISGGMNGEKRDQSVGNITKVVK